MDTFLKWTGLGTTKNPEFREMKLILKNPFGRTFLFSVAKMIPSGRDGRGRSRRARGSAGEGGRAASGGANALSEAKKVKLPQAKAPPAVVASVVVQLPMARPSMEVFLESLSLADKARHFAEDEWDPDSLNLLSPPELEKELIAMGLRAGPRLKITRALEELTTPNAMDELRSAYHQLEGTHAKLLEEHEALQARFRDTGSLVQPKNTPADFHVVGSQQAGGVAFEEARRAECRAAEVRRAAEKRRTTEMEQGQLAAKAHRAEMEAQRAAEAAAEETRRENDERRTAEVRRAAEAAVEEAQRAAEAYQAKEEAHRAAEAVVRRATEERQAANVWRMSESHRAEEGPNHDSRADLEQLLEDASHRLSRVVPKKSKEARNLRKEIESYNKKIELLSKEDIEATFRAGLIKKDPIGAHVEGIDGSGGSGGGSGGDSGGEVTFPPPGSLGRNDAAAEIGKPSSSIDEALQGLGQIVDDYKAHPLKIPDGGSLATKGLAGVIEAGSLMFSSDEASGSRVDSSDFDEARGVQQSPVAADDSIQVVVRTAEEELELQRKVLAARQQHMVSLAERVELTERASNFVSLSTHRFEIVKLLKDFVTNPGFDIGLRRVLLGGGAAKNHLPDCEPLLEATVVPGELALLCQRRAIFDTAGTNVGYGILVWILCKPEDVEKSAGLVNNSFELQGSKLVHEVLLNPGGRTPTRVFCVDAAKLDLLLVPSWKPPLRLTAEEVKVVTHPGATLVIGRSGSGKTTAISARIDRDREIYPFAEQLFVCRHPFLRKSIKRIFEASSIGPTSASFLVMTELVALVERNLGISWDREESKRLTPREVYLSLNTLVKRTPSCCASVRRGNLKRNKLQSLQLFPACA